MIIPPFLSFTKNACQQNTHDEVNVAVVQISVCAS